MGYTCKHEWGNNGVAIATSKHLLVFDHVFTPLPQGSKAEKGQLEGGKTITAKDFVPLHRWRDFPTESRKRSATGGWMWPASTT